MYDSVAIALIKGAVSVRLLRMAAAAALAGAHCIRGQDFFFAVQPIGRFKNSIRKGSHSWLSSRSKTIG